MNDTEILDLLKWTGHLEYPFGKKQTLKPIPKRISFVSLKCEVVQQAIASYQDFMIQNLDPLSMTHHGRPARCDGGIGPATKELMAQPRCGCCDYGPDVQPATGTGSWKRCHGIGNFHAARVYVHEGGMPGFLKPVFEEAWELNVAAYEKIGLRWIRTKSESEANIDFSFVSRSNGWIGLAIVGSEQSCSSEIWCRFLSTYRPSNILGSWTELIMHELGHNAGLQHTRGGIMNPIIITGLKPTWKGDPSESVLKRYYGGEPIITDPPEPPIVGDGIFGRLKLYRHDPESGEVVQIRDFDVLERADIG